jgi:hypothetical protein
LSFFCFFLAFLLFFFFLIIVSSSAINLQRSSYFSGIIIDLDGFTG